MDRRWTTRTFWAAAAIGVATNLAQAAPLSAEQATELLAKSYAANVKCKVLDAQDAADLGRLVEMAEQALVSKQDGVVADRAIARGQKVGAAVSCDSTTAQAIRGVLRAAREASSTIQTARVEPVLRGTVAEAESSKQSETTLPQVAPEDQSLVNDEISEAIDTDLSGTDPVAGEQELAVKPQKQSIQKQASKKPKLSTPPAEKIKSKRAISASAPASSRKLQSYGQLAQYYYLQRRCRSMSRAAINNLYGKVLATHRETLRVHGAALVAGVLRQAEAKARKGSC